MTTPPPAHTFLAMQAWMRDQGIAEAVIAADHARVQPVIPLSLPTRVARCLHCALPTRAGTVHAPCAQAAASFAPRTYGGS